MCYVADHQRVLLGRRWVGMPEAELNRERAAIRPLRIEFPANCLDGWRATNEPQQEIGGHIDEFANIMSDQQVAWTGE
jgi:hypothetical protein